MPTRRIAALALLVGIMTWTIPPVAPAGARAAPEPLPVGSNVVRIPYLGEIGVKPATSWRFADCPAIQAATPLVVSCAPDTLVARAPVFDAEAEPARVPVLIADGTRSVTVDYLFVLEPPPEPELDDLDYPYPFTSGSRALVPVSDLGISCGLCAETGSVRLQVGTPSPRRAGVAGVTPTHVVFAARSGFVGDVEIPVRARDDVGQRSTAATLTLRFSLPGADPLVAPHLIIDSADAAEPMDLLAAVLGPDAELVGCGAPAAGSVLCRPDGTAVFQAAESAVGAADQFAFHVATPNGDLATGSVTILRGGIEAPPALEPGAAPTSRADTAALVVPALPPPAEDGEDGTGIATVFSRLLDRLRA